MTLTTGQILQNRYRSVSLLGQGGMGAVYRAWDTRLNVPVALKEMIPQPGLDSHTLAQLRRQFEQEAMVLARLNHPHLVRVGDFFEEGSNAYLVMDFVAGESLAERIEREGALPEAEVLAWAEQLLDALGYCHAQGIIHRDVKPQNVIIRPGEGAPPLIGGAGGGAVLVDFGLVKLWDPHDPRTKTALRGMGTLEYAPPEQYSLRGQHTDPRSDVYGLGATLYHALTGEAPLSATDRMADPEQFEPLRSIVPGVSQRTEAAVLKAVELARSQRWQDAAEMAQALGGSAVAPARPAVPQRQPTKLMPETQPAAPSRQRAPVWAWALGGLVVVALVVGIVMGGDGPTLITEKVESPTLEVTSPVALPTETAVLTLSPTVEVTTQPIIATSIVESTATLVPTAIPAATTTPRCPTVQGPFATVWEAVQERLGCAQGDAFSGLIAEETFEGGKMFWREPIDTAQALVLFNDGTWHIFTHTPYIEGSPEFSCVNANTPAQCPPTPKRGFGMMWCDIPEIRNALGNALDCERSYQGSLQRFDGGSALRTDMGSIYIFYSDGSWKQW